LRLAVLRRLLCVEYRSPCSGAGILRVLFIGVVVKWLMDPKQALSARELTVGLRFVTRHIVGKGQIWARSGTA
jgi:hypothetical protein